MAINLQYCILNKVFIGVFAMKKPGRPKGSTRAVVAFRRALEHSLAETERRALEGDQSAQEALIHFAASKPQIVQSILPSAA